MFSEVIVLLGEKKTFKKYPFSNKSVMENIFIPSYF